ncbi:tricarballylate utilization 4Fe-4S protein TcuB [Photobacterium sp. ZSDE20]|nr:tricarballylate utilization 4Fe-4S protein TcuB [Photobacterium sp. ZSDE20]
MQNANTVQAIEVTDISSFQEARRQLEICNACRYCEGYCSVFPAVHKERSFSDANIQQLANLCHNCRGCFYACQFTAPHQFELNVPKALAEVRQDSWQKHAFPAAFATKFHKSGVAIASLVIIAFALVMMIMQSSPTSGDTTFYDLVPHNVLVAIFAPLFLFPLLAIAISLRNYWQSIEGKKIQLDHIKNAFVSAGKMKNLAGGHGDGCNFEEEDKFSHARRYYHQATMWGFLLCFAATSVATMMHYLLNIPAPYGFFSLPKLLGVSGGVLLSIGTFGLMVLKTKADKNLGDARVWGGEMAFVVLLFSVSTTGLLLWLLSATSLLQLMLAVHLASVAALFLLMPYSKMVHGFFRLAALIRNEQ